MSGLRLDVDIDRVMAELVELATHSDAPAPAVTRVVYSGVDVAARVTGQEAVSRGRAFGS